MTYSYKVNCFYSFFGLFYLRTISAVKEEVKKVESGLIFIAVAL